MERKQNYFEHDLIVRALKFQALFVALILPKQISVTCEHKIYSSKASQNLQSERGQT